MAGAMRSAMIDVVRTGVSPWECDQMGHLNVRHYFARATEGFAMLGLHMGLAPSQLREREQLLRAREQHIRFIRELRPNAYYTVRAGIVQASRNALQVYEELRLVHDDTLAASMLSEVMLVHGPSGDVIAFDDAQLARARTLTVEVPEEGGPRGIARQPPRQPPMREEALQLGMVGAYLSPVKPEDCDAHGMMMESAFMARVSDGIGHYFQAIRGPRAKGVGGAALEYRFVFHARPRLGDIIEVRSALKALGNKTNHICHWIFDVERGRCVATSEAIAVSFDLTARKAIPISDEDRAQMHKHLRPDLGV